MQIVQSILTKNPCYTAGRKITVKGLMLHGVGCNQPNASVFINNWNKASYNIACVHAFIDANTGIIYQTLPWDHRGWHCGKGVKGSGNNTHIGVEMCEPASIRYTSGSNFTCSDLPGARAAATRTYNAAVELYAYLCKLYNLNPLTQICSHKEGYKLGIATNHGDPEHLWRGLGLPYTMDTFRADVKKAMGSASAPSQSTPAETNKNFPTTPFIVEVKISDLNYRSLPSMSGTVKGQTGKGKFTITQVSNGWGKLKSGVGWIYLENAEWVKIGATQATSKPAAKPAASTTYKVKVDCGILNVRAGAGTGYKVTTTVKRNEVYTIVETKNNWGKLKSGAGWICLDYVKKV